MMKAKPIGLYVHIPFCLKKCNYCDFCSFSDIADSVHKRYIEALSGEIKSYGRHEKIKVDSIFFGGGTPSLLSTDEFLKICDCIHESFDISPECEFTVEANPKTLTEEKLRGFISCGVNRISIGMQTIHENEYKILGRIHDFSDFKSALSLVRSAGINNVNIDVMYGIPEQTIESFTETIDAVISFNPEHISVYGLMLEEGTPLHAMRDRLIFPSEDTECLMYATAAKLLSKNGYSHYEISNYALKGLESRHNLKYWQNEEYIGVGLSAYSFFENKRYGNTSDMTEYLSESSENLIYTENITGSESAFEYVMLGLRLKKGISLSSYRELYGVDFLSSRKEKITFYIDKGYMTLDSDSLALTEKGFYVSNAILAELI